MTNLALCLGAVYFGGGWSRVSNEDWTHEASPWLMLALANALLVASALYPRQIKSLGALSDGAQLRNLLYRPLPSVTQRRLDYFRGEATALTDAGNYVALKDLVTHWRGELSEAEDARWLSVANGGGGESMADRANMLQQLDQHPGLSLDRMWLLNAIAWDDLIAGGGELLAEADRFSAEAYAMAPWDAGVQNTRGWALVEMGQVKDGLTLLKQSLKGVIFQHDRAAVLCTLAIAEARRGRFKEAKNYEQQARRLDSACGLLPRVMRELEAKPSEVAPFRGH
jgi:tetratricopeptide (TPR) repeat protein